MKLKAAMMAGVALATLTPAFAWAQTQPTPPADDSTVVVVTGIRASLRSSLQTKRNSSEIVDAVSAEDAGKFPDTNVAESLQRVSGVQIQRNAGEGQFISVRGLGPEFNNVLMNGRTLPTDNEGREFSFDVLSPDLISKVEVYKSSNPELQEGGIGATVNIRTARPLDQKGRHLALDFSGGYDSLTKKYTPNFGGVYSYSNEARNFGILASLSYTDRESKRDFVQSDVWWHGPLYVVNAGQSATGLQPSDVHTVDTYYPNNLGFHLERESRKRIVGNLTLQWKPSENWLITVDGLFSRLDQKSKDSIFSAYYGFNPIVLNAQFDGTNSAVKFDRPGTVFATNNPALGVTPAQNDNVVTANNRMANTYEFGFNSQWQVSDTLKIEADLSAGRATRSAYNPYVVVGTRAINGQMYDATGGDLLPSLILPDSITDASLARAHWTNLDGRKVQDNLQEARLSADWTVDYGWLKSVEGGLFASNREKHEDHYSSPDGCAYCGYGFAMSPALVEVEAFDNFLSDVSGSEKVPAAHLTFDPYAVMAYLSQPANLIAAGKSADLVYPGGPYAPQLLPNEVKNVGEKVTAAYVNSRWAGERWSGNLGVRVVQVESTSTGFGQPLVSAHDNRPTDTNYTFVFGPATAISVTHKYTDVLPSLNVKYNLRDDMILRLAASRTLTRPTLTALGTDYHIEGRIGGVSSSGGNPYLTSMHSNNFDLSYEWYLSKTSYLSAAVFHKDVSDLLQNTTLPVTLALLPGEQVLDTRTRNGASGKIDGYEIAGQYSFEKLAGWLSGFGVTANYTHVDGTQKSTDLASTCPYAGLSPDSYNASAFYDNGRFQARLAYNWRSAFNQSCGAGTLVESWRDAYGQTDLSVRYNVTDAIQLYLNGSNLTDEKVHDYAGVTTRLLLLEDDGARYNIGIRFKY